MTIAETIYQKLKSAPPEVAQQVLDFLELLEARREKTANEPEQQPASFEPFVGILAGSPRLSGSPVEIQLRLREEWSD